MCKELYANEGQFLNANFPIELCFISIFILLFLICKALEYSNIYSNAHNKISHVIREWERDE